MADQAAEGVEAYNARADEMRKQAAYNALAKTYGAIAGDPTSALTMQEYGQRQLTNPIAVQQANANLTGTTLDNTGKQQTNDFNALANPIKIIGLQDTNANTEATTANTKAETNKTNTLLPGEVSQQGATLQQTRAQTGLIGAETAHTNVETQQGRLNLNTAQAAQNRQAAMGILASLSDTAASGGDVGGKFDTLAPLIAKYEGVDPSHLPPLRAALVKDPIGTINKLTDAINAANITAMGGQGGSKGSSAALAMMKFGQQQMSVKDGLNFTQQRVAAVPGLTDDIAALIPQMSSLAVVRKAKSEIPGTAEYKYQQAIEQLKPNLSLDDIRNLKSTGTSLGRVTNQEMSMAANAMGNMDLGQDPSTLRANLARIKNTYTVVNSNLAADIQRLGNGTGGGHLQAKTYVKGQVYQDANGNKAVWDGAKFAPTQ